MRKLILIVLTAFSGAAFAGAGDEILKAMSTGGLAGDVKPMPYAYGALRMSAGYGLSEIYNVKSPTVINEYTDGKGPWGEFDVGMIMMLHFGFQQTHQAVTQVNFNGAAAIPTRVSLDKYSYGLKLVLPIMYVNPWVGAGVISGKWTVGDNEENIPKESSRMLGRYWHAGLDILFSPHLGLRLGYSNNWVKTRKFLSLGNTPLEMQEHFGQAGLMLYF